MTLEEIDIEMAKFQKWLDATKKDIELMDARIKAAKAMHRTPKVTAEDTISHEDSANASKEV